MAWPLEGIELGVEGWSEGLTFILAVAMLIDLLFLALLTVFCMPATRRRRFWCAVSRRPVEVEFEECGLRGLHRSLAVRSCSAFRADCALTCGQRCLDPGFRRALPLPVGTR